jgi:hypothetical protein
VTAISVAAANSAPGRRRPVALVHRTRPHPMGSKVRWLALTVATIDLPATFSH